MADGYVGLYEYKTIPDQPTGLTLTEVGNKVQISWSVDTDDTITEYEVWSSPGNDNNYSLIATISKNEFEGDTSITVVDETYETISTNYYKVYARYISDYSLSLSGNITLSYAVPDPTGLVVTPSFKSITLNWVVPDDRLLKSIKVTHDSNTDQSSLSESNATEVYNGQASSFTYEVPDSESTHYHQFWISSITK